MLPITKDNITDVAVSRWSNTESERLAEVMTSMVRHLHSFAQEVELTEQEWMDAIEWLTAVGKMSDEKRQEFILASDVVGLSMLVVQMNDNVSERATPSTVLGPFYIPDSPPLSYGEDMSDELPGKTLFIVGRVTDVNGDPVPEAILDVWQADAEGYYEAQMEEVDEARLRARYEVREDGSYCIRTIAPRGYTIPMDGPVGDLIKKTNISPFRPAHVHFRIEVDGYEPLVTHLFQEGADYLDSDVVFGTKEPLVTRFEEHEPGPTPDGGESEEPFLAAHYDFALEPRV